MDSLSSTNYKGKVTNRGWSQLPAELIRLIATHYLWDISTTKHCPDTWNIRAFWQSRIVYTVIRDAVEMEKFMQICPQWGLAVEHHHFWDHAVGVIDPRDTLVMHSFVPQQPPNTNTMLKANGGSAAASMAQPKTIKLSPYAHFKQITHWCCIVCRINHPQTNTGLLQARHPFYHTLTGPWGLCREHNGGPDRPSARDRNDRERERERERSTFCGLCLREAQPFDLHVQYGYPYGYGQSGFAQTGMDLEKTRRNPMLYAGCMENEDETTFPGVETTCRACRQEWLMSRIHQTADYRWYRERARSSGGKSGLPRLDAWDWDHEARSSVESFIELGEGTVDDIVALVRDRWWLRTRTRLGGMLEQAIAAERFLGGETSLPGTGHRSRGRSMRGADGNLDIDDDVEDDTEEEDEEEEDTELLQLTEDSGVRDLALSDWARRRILDGFWISPADQWYKYFPTPMPGSTPPQLRAVHPCPWSLESEEVDEDVAFSDDVSTDADAEHVPTTHPLPSTIHSPIPPSFHLCEEAYSAFQKEFRTVMLPGMRNLVRRLVIECHAASVEAARLGVPLNPKIADPAIRASKMTIEDVVRELRENEGLWWDGWDWIRHGEARNENDTGMATSTRTAESDGNSGSCRHHEHEREDGRGRGHGREGSDKSSSDASTPTSTSTLTSPVLSTSTLGTTPSPPPQPQTSPGAADEKDNHHDNVDSPPSVSLVETGVPGGVDRDNVKLQPILVPGPEPEVVVKPITIPISPVLDPPRMLRPIPYIPMSVAHLPQFSLDSVKNVWREACAPLYHCRCRICVRAAEKANAAMGGTNQLGSDYQHQQVQQKEKAKDIAWDRKLESDTERSRNGGTESQLVQIRLEEADDGDVDVDGDRDGDGEADTDGTPVRVEYDAEVEEYEYVSEEVEYEDEYYDDDDDDVRSDVGVVGTKGRYVRDDEDDEEEVDEDAKLQAYRRSRERDRYTRSRSPEIPPTSWDPEPKGTIDLLSSTFSSHETLVASSPARRIPGSRKRSCDEVDGLQGDDAVIGGGGLPSTPPKRARRDSPPPSSLGLGLFPVPADPASPARKRSSEEVDLESNAEESYERGTERGYERKHVHIVDAGGGGEWKEDGHRGSERRFKRFKTSSSEEEDADTPPRSLTGDSDAEERVVEVKV